MRIINGAFFGEDGVFHNADIELKGDRIAAIGGALDTARAEPVLDAGDCYVVPGFVDVHIHGAVGADFSDGEPDGVRSMARFLLSQGVTSFLGTSMALPEERLERIFREARPLFGQTVSDGATLRGINMEGPFFSQEKRGAQNPEYIVPPDFEMFRRLNEASGGNIRTVAVAPETEGGLDFVERAGKVCSVSIAHSCANYDTASQAFARGANHVTHVFNGMSPFHHRDPGIVGAAVGSGAYVEVICDGIHVHPAVIRSVFCLYGDDRMCLISDAMRACGMPEGKYDLGGQLVTVANGCATIDTGSLAGSVCVLSDCFRNAVRFGIPLESALKAATINPARSVGLDGEVGSIAVGKRADLLVLDKALAIREIVIGGQLYRTA